MPASLRHTYFCKAMIKINLEMSIYFLKLVDFLWNRTVGVVVDKLSSTSVDFIRSESELEICAYMESNRLTEPAQSLLGGVKSESPKGREKLGNEIIELIVNLIFIC